MVEPPTTATMPRQTTKTTKPDPKRSRAAKEAWTRRKRDAYIYNNGTDYMCPY